jgi:CysZ protein
MAKKKPESRDMGLLSGLFYNLKGFALALRVRRLLFLGMLRFLILLAVTLAAAGLVAAYHQEVLEILWAKPEGGWLVWIWHLVSWFLALLLLLLSTVLSYLFSQVVFSVWLMDQMSRWTERMLTGEVGRAPGASWTRELLYLVGQEIPRAVVPVLVALGVLLLGWLTPLGPLVAVLSSAVTVVFLAWDNTDLVPARRLVPFRERFRFLVKNLAFHLGFGLPFLIPVANILFLSYAPVGATLFHVEREKRSPKGGAMERPTGKPVPAA